MNDALQQWLATRPASVQALAARFPPGDAYVICGRTLYVIAYAELEDGSATLEMTDIDPHDDYDGAVASRFVVCPKHLEASDD